MLLDGKLVLVTGASTGIGRALCLALAERGALVYASARRLEALDALKASVRGVVRVDVCDLASVEAALAQISTREGGRYIDVLVNNAGVNRPAASAELPMSEHRALFETNYFAVAALSQLVAGPMADRGSGLIVNVGSIVGDIATPFGAPYSATKAAVGMLTHGLRMELAPFGVEVCLVKPGAIQSEIATNALSAMDGYLDAKTSRYAPIMADIEARASASQQNPTPTAVFARHVAARLDTRGAAPAVVRFGKLSTIMWVAGLLPHWLQDTIFSARFGLRRLAGIIAGGKKND
jgi:NAD(P)-dependent dehydrogenase (short-subunit alcohol dehydrogenase family)